jgi:hypothetical protein
MAIAMILPLLPQAGNGIGNLQAKKDMQELLLILNAMENVHFYQTAKNGSAAWQIQILILAANLQIL